MKLILRQQVIAEAPWMVRNIRDDDIPALGQLMLDAYRGTIDDEGEKLEDAIREVRGTIEGQYGPFLRDCSFAIDSDGDLAAACLVTWSEILKAPFLGYSITRPDHRNRGLAAFLIKTSINALVARGHRELYLVVTQGNAPAEHLYEKIGFRFHGPGHIVPLEIVAQGQQPAAERETL